MIRFILVNVLLISFGGILYIVARTLPRLEEESQKKEEKLNLLEKFIISDLSYKIDAIFYFYIVKILRILKVLVLRLDNYLTNKLKKINIKNHSLKNDFFDLNSKQQNNEIEDKKIASD